MRKLIPFVLSVLLLRSAASAVTVPMDFSDVTVESWYYDCVEYAFQKGLVTGTDDKKFYPDEPMTRGMFVTVLGRAAENLGEEISGEFLFADVVDGEYFSPYVRWAAARGIVDGYSPTLFGPHDTVTREQMAAILVRFAQALELELPQGDDPPPFSDGAEVSGWAAPALEACVRAGILQGYGDGSIRPAGRATRAEALRMVQALLLGCGLELSDNPYVRPGTHLWYDAGEAPLIAHAGGAVTRPDGTRAVETNALETLEESYALGFRVFEYDLNLTTDGFLAVIHDWSLTGGPLSAEQWLNYPWGGLTPMLLGDILDFMVEHDDMFLVTDTKSYALEAEEITLQFQCIYDEAVARDPALLNRIIPQIYNQEMYPIVTSVYPFPSIIYTLYASEDSQEEVIEFVRDREDIGTVVWSIVRPEFYAELNGLGKRVYTHTINDLEEMAAQREGHVYGFYTDLVTPEVFNAYFYPFVTGAGGNT